MKEMTATSYARYVKARDAAHMRDSQVAEAAGVPQPTLSDWKSGRSMPKIDKLARIAAAIGTTASEIYGETL